ncbi:G8 domain-containing protein [Marinimicrobium locisalis]|uniref:G8 domain-containing protein n=1 Tax=Marinimicrobium locisalis TaxID=546022 RepID=UPI0032220329
MLILARKPLLLALLLALTACGGDDGSNEDETDAGASSSSALSSSSSASPLGGSSSSALTTSAPSSSSMSTASSESSLARSSHSSSSLEAPPAGSSSSERSAAASASSSSSVLASSSSSQSSRSSEAEEPAGAGLWSDPDTWPGGEVPREGQAVVIREDMDVTLDVTPPVLRSLTIEGGLTFGEADLELTTDWILVRGLLQIGTETAPFGRQAIITLVNNEPDENVEGMGDRGIMVVDGALKLYGNRTHTWSQLAQTASVGDTTVRVQDASEWRVGDELVLASTDFDSRQAEQKTITGVDGDTLTLDGPLEYMHYGAVTEGVDQRGEVGLLTRNIRVQSSADSENDYQGGHVMAMNPGQIEMSGVELYRMGQHLNNGRYPVHWHLMGDADGQFIENSAIHHSYNRCVTVHGTNNVRVENNVAFDHVGHCFFLEDGAETGNQFVSNLGIQTKCHPTRRCRPFNQSADDILLPSDNNASTFWITNPDNIFRNNVAAGSEAIGFWLALPEHPTGAFEGTEQGAAIWPRRTALRAFTGNVAHSNYDGMMFDRGPNPDGTFPISGNNHEAYADPTDTSSERLITRMEDFTAYKNRNNGVWARGFNHEFVNFALADNAIGFTHASGSSDLMDSLIVGETENQGTPTSQAERDYGRSLPHRSSSYPIHGYEYYDFTNRFSNVTFRNFEANSTREAGAISYLFFTDFAVSTNNSAEGAVFDNAKPVLFPQIRSEWAFHNDHADGYRSAVFQDLDGSVGGIAGAYIVINDPFFTDATDCMIQASWNAAVCQGDYGRLTFNGRFGGGSNEDPGIVTVERTGNGGSFDIHGTSFGGMSSRETTIRYGTEVEVTTENAVDSLSISAREGASDSWVLLRFPQFSAVSTGTEQESLAALRAAGSTSYYRSEEALYVKLFAGGFFGGGATVCTGASC